MTDSTTQKTPFFYEGDGASFAVLMLKNLFLSILTLGIYRAWARTATRRYIWGNVQFMGDRGAYTGTGKELFRGWAKLVGLVVVLLLLANILSLILKSLSLIAPFVYVLVFAIARYSGLRYRMSRTIWRQIRFGVDKDKMSTRDFLKTYLLGVFLTAVTLGIYYPWFQNGVRKFLTDKSRFGSAHFSYDGDGGDYAAIYFKGLILSIVTLGIYIPWNYLNLERYRLEHTVFQGKRLSISLGGGELLQFALLSYFGTIFTFGLAAPWFINWGLKIFINRMAFDGAPDLSQVVAHASDGSAMADDLLSGYDIDLGI